MGVPGPKPKPRKAKPGRGKPDSAPLDGKVDTTCPAWLDNYGKTFWRRYVPKLAKEGHFKTIDRPAFETMANCYSQFRKSQKIIEDKGFTFTTQNGYEQQRPEVSIMNKAQEQLRMLFAEFGMTASSRTRLDPDGEGDDDEREDWSDTGIDR